MFTPKNKLCWVFVAVPKGLFSVPLPISLGLNVMGLLFLAFTSITFNFPTTAPVTPDSMNYTSAAIGIIGLISLVTWFTTGRKHFTGPGGLNAVAVAAPGEVREEELKEE